MTFPQGVPAVNDPFVTSDLKVTQAWYRFLLNMWQRTGGALGNTTGFGFGAIGSWLNLNINCVDGVNAAITVDQIVLVDAGGNNVTIKDVAVNCNFGGKGLNRLDANTNLVAGLPIYVFVISDGISKVDTIASSSKDNPALPSGYTFKKIVSAICGSDNASVFGFVQRNKTLQYVLPNPEFNVSYGPGQSDIPLPILFSVPPLVLLNFVISAQASGSEGGYVYFYPTFGRNPVDNSKPWYTLPKFVAQITFIFPGFAAVSQQLLTGIMVDEQRMINMVASVDPDPVNVDVSGGTTGYDIPFI